MSGKTATLIRRYVRATFVPRLHPKLSQRAKERKTRERYQKLKAAWMALDSRQRGIFADHMREHTVGID